MSCTLYRFRAFSGFRVVNRVRVAAALVLCLAGWMLPGQVAAQTAAVFNPAAVGVSGSSAQTINVVIPVTGQSSVIAPTATLHYGTSYSAGAVTCTGVAGNQSCTVPVTFTPIYPGGRKDAVFLSANGTRVGTALLYGIGNAPLSLLQPGVTLLLPPPFNGYLYDAIADENGTVYFVASVSTSGGASAIVSLTKNGTYSTLPITGLNGPRQVAIDGAGVLYISDGTANGPTTTYDTVTGVQGSIPFPTIPSPAYLPGIAAGRAGNIYETDGTNVFTRTPSGSFSQTAISPGITQAYRLLTDQFEDIFVAGYAINEISYTGLTQRQINTTQTTAISVDAANTLYAVQQNSNGVAELPASNYGTAVASIDTANPSIGVATVSDGTVYITRGAGADKMDRSQGAIAFGAVTGSTTQTVSIYNGGNMPLTISALSVSGTGYTLGTASTSPCGSGTAVAAGALCNLSVTFNPQHAGAYTGSVTLTSNSLNATTATQTIALSGSMNGVYVTMSPTTLSFGNQVIGTTSAPQTITFTNSGTYTAQVYGTSFGNPPIAVALGGCSNIAVGGTCTATVTYSPTSTGAYNSTGSLYNAAVGVTGADGNPVPGPNISLTITGNGLPVVTQTGGGTNNTLIFNPAAVGIAAASAQTLTATFTVAGYASLVTPTAAMHYGLAYTAGAVTCTGVAGAQVCSVPVTFTPNYPGGRKDALFLSVGGVRIATALAYGVGQAPLGLIQPGLITQPVAGSSSYQYRSVVDENGTVYVVDEQSSQILTITKAGVVATLPIAGLNSPREVGIDGAGVLYIADQTPRGGIKTYDTVQGTQGVIPYPSGAFYMQGVTAGNTGNIYETDYVNVYTVPVSGNGTAATTAISPANTQANTMVVDSNENLFVGGYAINELTAAGVQTQINTVGAGDGLGVDAAGTLYATRYTGTGGVAELPATNYAQYEAAVDTAAGPLGASVGPDGTVYVGNYSQVDKVDRTQAAFTFNSYSVGSAATPQVATLYNGGNTALTLTSYGLTGDPNFTVSPTTGSCTNGLVIQPGALCTVTVNITAPHNGTYNGTLSFTTNSLNTAATTNSISLYDQVAGSYVTASPTTLNFGNQVIGTTSAPQTVTLTNSGTVAGQVYGSNFGAPFTVTLGSGCANIAVGASCTASVTFTPSAVIPYSTTGMLYETNVGYGSGPNISLTFTGTGTPKAGATLTATTIPGPTIYFPDEVTMSLTATGPGAVPGGTVTYSLDGGMSQMATLTAGSALVDLGLPATVGAHAVVYTYNGDSNYSAGSAQTLNYTVTEQPTSLLGTNRNLIFNVSNTAFAAVDAQDNIYLTDQGSSILRKLDLSGNLTTVTGTSLKNPAGITRDSSGNFYIADSGNARVVEFSAAGVQTTLPMTGLSTPGSLALDPAQANLYVVDGGASQVYKFNLATSVQTTIPTTYITGAGAFDSVAVDAAGNLFYTQRYSYQNGGMWEYSTSGVTTQIYLPIASPTGLVFDKAGNLYMGNSGNVGTFRLTPDRHFQQLTSYGTSPGSAVTSQGNLIIPYGTGVQEFDQGAFVGNAGTCAAYQGGRYQYGGCNFTVNYHVPSGTTISSFTLPANNTSFVPGPGNLAVSVSGRDLTNTDITLRPMLPGAEVGSVVVTPSTGSPFTTLMYGVGVQSEAAFMPGNITTPAISGLKGPDGVAIDQSGAVYISDATSHQVQMVVGGVGTVLPFTGLLNPSQVAIDGAGTVYVLDPTASKVYSLTTAGAQTTVFTLSGQSTLITTTSMTVDGAGNVYVGGSVASSTGAGAIVRVSNGVYSVFAMTAGTASGIAVDQNGLIYTSEQGNLRTYDRFANATTIVNTGYAAGLSVDPSGTVYLGTTTANVTTVSPAGVVSTIAIPGLTVNGGVAVDRTGSLAVVDAATAKVFLIDRTTQAFAFGNVAVGSTGTFTSTLFNAGNQPLGGFSNFTPSGNGFGGGSASTCLASTTLAPAATCTLTSTFTPTTPGPVSASYTYSDGTYTQTTDFTYISLPFSGNGVAAAAPQATLAPTGLTFTATVNTTSAAQTLVLSNPGTAALAISGISVTGTNAANFAQTNTCGTSLAANATCNILVTFSPTAATGYTATVSVADNATGTPQTATLSGTGTAAPAPVATLSPTVLSFSSTVNTASAAQTVVLSNTGNAALAITGISFTGASAGNYAQTNNCGSSLAASATCTISIVFTPTTVASSLQATLSVADNATGSPQTAALNGTGTATPAPQAVLTPSSLVFSAVSGTTSAVQTITLSNPGTAALTVTGVAISGANAGSFAQTNTCTSVAPLGNCVISVTFSPSAATSYGASVVVTDNATGSPQTATLTGTGTAAPTPQAVLSPTAVTFASTQVGATSAAQTITLSNPGTAALSIGGITLGGTNAGSFAQTNTCGATLAAAASCTISVTFKPATATAGLTATVSVADNATGSPQVATLTGTGTAVPAPQAVLSPTALTFSGTVGTTTAAQVVTLSNPGNAALTVSGIAVSGANAASFAQTNTCGGSLAAAGSCTISVTFSPTAAGSAAATVSVTDNATGSPQTVALSGTAVAAPAPQAVLTPSALAFASTVVGTTTAAQTITLSNPGTAALTITGISLGGANAGSFAQTNTCGATLAVSASCVISVTFTPASATAGLTATITVADNATGSPQVATLTGTGTAVPAPLAVLSPTALTFTGTVGTTSAAQQITLTNPGTAALTISGISLAGANVSSFAQSSTCGASLAIGGSCVISVTFTPATVATGLTATLSVGDNATGSPQTAILTGTGTAVPAPLAVLTPNTLTFASTVVGTASAAQSITLSNPGNAALTISGISLGGANASSFAQTNTCGATLAAAGSCTISVVFTPGSVASGLTAVLSVADNAAGAPQTATLTGSGIASNPTYTVVAQTPTVSAAPGSVASFNINVASLGGSYTNLVTLAASGLPAGATATFVPAAVTPGASGAVTVMSVQTPSLFARATRPGGSSRYTPLLAALAGLPLLGFIRARRRLRRSSQRLLLLLLAVFSLLPLVAITGCSGGYFGDTPHTYVITVTGTSGSLQQSTTVSLTVQ